MEISSRQDPDAAIVQRVQQIDWIDSVALCELGFDLTRCDVEASAADAQAEDALRQGVMM